MTKSVEPSGVVRVGVHEAKTRLSQLLRLVDGGQEVVISRGGEPVARLVPIHSRRTRQLGVDAGSFRVPDDFDAPLPADVLATFST
jgi:prevent-host-death family protein